MLSVSLFQWLQSVGIGRLVSKSTYLFPIIEVVHLFGITLLLGGAVAINLRLLSGRASGSDADRFSPIFWAGFWTAILTGIVLFLAEAVKCYYNEAFLWKMILLVVATLFHQTAHRMVRRNPHPNSFLAKAVAMASLLLWFGVGIAGRLIGFI